MGLPPLPVPDLKIHPRDNDLIIATHARGFYILDDITPLQELAQVINNTVALFKPIRATRYTPLGDVHEGGLGDKIFVGTNKPYGAIISYYLAETPGKEEKFEIEILDSAGESIRKLEGTKLAGINRAVWNLREDPPGGFQEGEGASRWNPSLNGPYVLPGDYTVRLSALGQTSEQSFKVRLDPRVLR